MELDLIEVRRIFEQQSTSAGSAEQRHGFSESHVVVELDEADEIAAASAAIAIKQVLDGVHQKAGLAVGVQGTQSHQPSARDASSGFPTLSFQVVQQGDLLFDGIHGRPGHGEFASRRRVRLAAAQSQARMVGARKKPVPPSRKGQKVFQPQDKLSSLRKAQRRRVAGSGRRLASFICGPDCSQLAPPRQVESHACCRQRKLYWPEGGDQLGRMVNVTSHRGHKPRRTQIQSRCSS
jgi:hypothetical protein